MPNTTTTYYASVSNFCGTATDSIVITVFPTPVANAGKDTTILFGQSVQLYGVQGQSYLWSPATGLSCTNCPDPIANPKATTTYYLTVTGANGCESFDTMTVFIDASHSLFIPNIFSPNGDGNNDVLFVRGKGIELVLFTLYNRWGDLIFESNDINTGWDGTYKSQQVNSGVFVYYVTGTYTDDIPFDMKGNVSLVR